MNLLIIGGGIAGTTCAEEFHKLSPDATITIISDEKHPLYSRVLLPHYLKSKVPRERVFLKTADWYASQNISLVHDTVISLNTRQKVVQTFDDTSFTYDKLVIAGGGKPNHLPISSDPRAHHLQTIEDADNLLKALNERDGKETEEHIFGGGFIAMDFLDIFADRKFKTHIHIRGNQFFPRSFDKESSDLFSNHLAKVGVEVHFNDPCDTIPESANIVGVGVGLDSRFPWVNDAGVDVRHGIVCNQFLETSEPDVYSAGDCAEYYDVFAKRHLHIGNWANAQMQGRKVASVINGEHSPYKFVSSYSAHALGMDIVSIGDTARELAEEIIVRHQDNSYAQFFTRENRLVGAVLINRNTERASATKLIETRTDLSIKKELLANPNEPLANLYAI